MRRTPDSPSALPAAQVSAFTHDRHSNLTGGPEDDASIENALDLNGELATLRDFNAKLLERVSEMRRRNFELSKLEEAHRNKDQELIQARQNENKLRLTLAKLTDEKWAKDLEIAALQKLNENQSAADALLAEKEKEIEALRLNFEHKSRLEMEAYCQLEGDQTTRIRELEIRITQITTERDEKINFLELARAEQTEKYHLAMEALTSSQSETSALRMELNALRDGTSHALKEASERHALELESLRLKEDELTKTYENRFAQLEFETSETVRKLSEQVALAQHRRNEEMDVHSGEMAQVLQKTSHLELSLAEREEQIEEARNYLAQLEEQLADQRAHDAKLNTDLIVLRNERVAFEKRTQESMAASLELRALLETQKTESRIELRNLRMEAEQSLNELQAGLKAKLQSEFQAKFEIVLAEKAKLQALLDIKDNSSEIERKDLQKKQVHLNLLEQQLRLSADHLQSGKSEILKLSKQLATELQQCRSHPGANLPRQLEERSHTVMTIIKTLDVK